MRTDLEVRSWLHLPDRDQWVLYFPFARNPLPMNGSRGNSWRPRARKTRDIRDRTTWLARAACIPAMEKCEVQLVWWVADHRVRDEDNLAALEKPMFDGVRAAGVVPDDRPGFMLKPRARIRHLSEQHHLVTEPCFTLHVTRRDTEEEW
nr:hypothetical protein [Microbacterium bovistercoris]